jgi:hypothetical protein
MAEAIESAGPGIWNKWRIARWTAALVLVLTPAVMMRISDGRHWTPGSFVMAGTVIGGFLLLYELAERASGSRAYRAGVAVALATAFLTIWTTIVRDDGNGMSFFVPVMGAMLGAFTAWCQPAGMARAMLGVAIMQALLGLAIATAPAAASGPDGPTRALVAAAFFTLLWLTASALFHAAARRSRPEAVAA